jgi:hypothetical protein
MFFFEHTGQDQSFISPSSFLRHSVWQLWRHLNIKTRFQVSKGYWWSSNDAHHNPVITLKAPTRGNEDDEKRTHYLNMMTSPCFGAVCPLMIGRWHSWHVDRRGLIPRFNKLFMWFSERWRSEANRWLVVVNNVCVKENNEKILHGKKSTTSCQLRCIGNTISQNCLYLFITVRIQHFHNKFSYFSKFPRIVSRILEKYRR